MFQQRGQGLLNHSGNVDRMRYYSGSRESIVVYLPWWWLFLAVTALSCDDLFLAMKIKEGRESH